MFYSARVRRSGAWYAYCLLCAERHPQIRHHLKMPYRIYLCGTGDYDWEVPNSTCPNAMNHTPSPKGYIDWHDWANEMKKSYKQKRCPVCRRWVILELKSGQGKEAPLASVDEPPPPARRDRTALDLWLELHG